MNTYRVTIINNISNKKRRFNVEAFSFEKAVEVAKWWLTSSSEDIIKVELKD